MSHKPTPPPKSPQRLAALNAHADTQNSHSHSFIVRKLRWLLPIMAMGIVLVLLIWPRLQTELENIRFKVAPIDEKVLELAATETRLIAADFSSVDTKGRPYRLLADHAIQKNDNPDFIELDSPKATLQTSPTESLNLQSRTGLMNQSTSNLILNDDVTLTRTDGTTLTTQNLNLNLETHDAQTDQPVTIRGPQFDLDATALNTTNSATLITFQGPATLVLKSSPPINPQKAK